MDGQIWRAQRKSAGRRCRLFLAMGVVDFDALARQGLLMMYDMYRAWVYVQHMVKAGLRTSKEVKEE